MSQYLLSTSIADPENGIYEGLGGKGQEPVV